MKFIAYLIYIPLQIIWLPLSVIGVIMVGYGQLVVSKKLGVSNSITLIIPSLPPDNVKEFPILKPMPGSVTVTPVIAPAVVVIDIPSSVPPLPLLKPV